MRLGLAAIEGKADSARTRRAQPLVTHAEAKAVFVSSVLKQIFNCK